MADSLLLSSFLGKQKKCLEAIIDKLTAANRNFDGNLFPTGYASSYQSLGEAGVRHHVLVRQVCRGLHPLQPRLQPGASSISASSGAGSVRLARSPRPPARARATECPAHP
eukprot:7031320-Prymnesium_polylepis.1